ncbi:CW-type Zinc Finger [Striga asiatica]|uniref:CW-type Zinc Finger n=1 Tax=Striga asiatica TaxID=4170 RepID=A0A5A7QBQ3_STRAF|nr:CW-type Zinc Finger [Striga asiatica]
MPPSGNSRLLLPPQPLCSVLELQQRLLFQWGPLKRAPHEKRKWGREKIPPQVPDLLLRLPVQPIGQPDHLLHVGLHLDGQLVQIVAAVVGGTVLEPRHLGDEVGFGADEASDPEPLLALADEEESIVGEALVPDDLADAADVRGAGGGSVGVDRAEAEVGVEEGVHHHPVLEIEDVDGEGGAGEEDGGEGEKGELDGVVGFRGIGVVIIREGGSGAGKGDGPAPPQVGKGEEAGGGGFGAMGGELRRRRVSGNVEAAAKPLEGLLRRPEPKIH